MAGLLEQRGYHVTLADKESADVWLLNSCTVKTPSEDTFNNDVLEAQKRGKAVVLAGCVPQVRTAACDSISEKSHSGDIVQIIRLVPITVTQKRSRIA